MASQALDVVSDSMNRDGCWYKLQHCCLNYRVYILDSRVYSKLVEMQAQCTLQSRIYNIAMNPNLSSFMNMVNYILFCFWN